MHTTPSRSPPRQLATSHSDQTSHPRNGTNFLSGRSPNCRVPNNGLCDTIHTVNTATEGLAPEAEALRTILERRHSCRAFAPTPVSSAVLDWIFSTAQRTPSWCNAQSWHVHLTSGEATIAFSRALQRSAEAGDGRSDIPPPSSYEGVYRQRQIDSGRALYSELGIAREDYRSRRQHMLENLRFFGAPHVAVISAPKSLGTYGVADCGAYVSTLLNAAESRGVAAVAQGAIAMFSNVVHAHLGIEGDRNIVCGVALGYADESHPANRVRTSRAPLGEVVSQLE